jgi:DNA-binding transcriptional LysR family regulator
VEQSRDEVHERLVDAAAPRLRQFAVVAREQHVTRAADQLGLAQSTLSRNIARLEADLGTALFVRAGRTVRLTRHGRQLLPHVERALLALSDGLDELAQELHPDTGRIAFAFLHSLGAKVVPVILRDFRRHHPGVRFTLVHHANDAMLEQLRAGTVDLCLTSPVPDDAVFRFRQLDVQRLCLMVPRGHRLAARKRVRLAEAADEDFIGMEHGYGLRRLTDEWCRQAGFTPRLAFEGEEIDTVLGLVAIGLGVALMPKGAGGPHDVVELEVSAPRTTRTIALVWRADRALPPPIEAFRRSVLTYRGRLLTAR